MDVVLHPVAGKYLERIPQPSKGRVKAALKGLEKEPPEGNIRPYEGNPGVWRLKVAGYRVLFKVEVISAGGKITLVTHIEPRGQAYTKKTKKRRG